MCLRPAEGCYPELLPYLMRIGHGIQIPLQHPDLLREIAARGQCLEVCPTTYLKTGTLHDIQPAEAWSSIAVLRRG
jgi:adenosine deaminase